MSLFARKLVIAGAVAALGAFVTVAPSLIGMFEQQDWGNLRAALWSLVFGAGAAALRAVVALLTAFVPSDAQHGVNIVGKFKP